MRQDGPQLRCTSQRQLQQGVQLARRHHAGLWHGDLLAGKFALEEVRNVCEIVCVQVLQDDGEHVSLLHHA